MGARQKLNQAYLNGALVLAAVGAVAGWLVVDPPGSAGAPVSVTIPQGASTAAIATTGSPT